MEKFPLGAHARGDETYGTGIDGVKAQHDRAQVYDAAVPLLVKTCDLNLISHLMASGREAPPHWLLIRARQAGASKGIIRGPHLDPILGRHGDAEYKANISST